MTIEHSTSAPSAGQASQRSQAAGHAGRAAPGGAAAALADGFSALLLGLGDAASELVSATAAQTGLAPGDNGGTGAPPADATQATESSAQALLAQLLGLAAGSGVGLPSVAPSAPSPQGGALGAQAIPVAASVATAGQLPGGGSGPGTAQATHPGASLRGGLKDDGSEARTLAAGDPAVDMGGGGPGGKASGARPALAKGDMGSQGQKIQAALQAVQADKIPGASATFPLARPAEALALPGVVSALADTDGTGGPRRRERTTVGVERFRPEAWSLPGGGWAAFEAGPGAIMAPGGVTPAPTADMAVAEQVKYWIANDIQNAELRLDDLGGDAVQVNISMSGNEAQVVFRSDQAHARELLGGAMAQLDQMLRDQGLSLSAAWVGGSGAQGGQAAPQQRPDQAAAGAVGTAESGPKASGSVRVVTTDRAVDLFV